MATTIKNVSDQERELVVGNITHIVEPGETLDVPEGTALSLLEQLDNWGKPSALTRDELAEEYGEEHLGLSRTELLVALYPDQAEPAGPKTKADFAAALETLGVEVPAKAKLDELQALYEDALADGPAESTETSDATGDADPGANAS